MARAVVAWAALLLLAAAMPVLAEVPSSIPNSGVVIEHGIYRGGQPDADDLAKLAALGVRTILKLNTHDLEREKAACDRLGLRLVHLPTKAETIASKKSCRVVARALAVLEDRDNWPVYVHCEHGRDRTGYIVGVYRMRVDGWSWPEVDRELARYGHQARERSAYPAITRGLERGLPDCPP
jgi:protein tyrosine/serine phosphatase